MNRKTLLFIAVVVVVAGFIWLAVELSKTNARLSVAEQQISAMQNREQIEQIVGNPGRTVVEGFMKSKATEDEA